MMTQGRGFSNAKAKRELGWELRYPSWRQGFKEELAMTRAEEFEGLRPLLFSIAYRLLGSVGEAEDAVQETWLRYESSPTQPRSTKAFLSAVVTRISIDVLRSARVRREHYVGEWFPEPLLTDPYEDPAAVGGAGGLGVDGGAAAARAAEPAGAGGLRAAGGVRLRLRRRGGGGGSVGGRVSAARGAGPPPHGRRAPPVRGGPPGARRAGGPLLRRARDGDVDGLRELLAADVQMVGDGGGKAPALARTVVGADRVARVLAAIFPALLRTDVRLEPCQVNGQPGAILRDRDGKVGGTMTLDVLDGRIQAIRSVSNPDKLGHLGPVADGWAVARAAKQARRT